MPYGQGLKIHAEIAEQEQKLTALYGKRDEQLKLCLQNGYCPNCATPAGKPPAGNDGAWFEKCAACGQDYVVKAEAGS